ncbi:MAG TPA: FtsX-like permease family protein [Acidimicrobiia bacterium]|nr:FtsX-like permease family protein [Acidimicrobiia bacterium]
MGAVRFRARAELRGRWRALLALALLAGIAGAASIAAFAGARRTDTAFARMLASTNAADVLVNPDFGNDSELDIDAVRALPMVAEAAVGRGLAVTALPIHSVADLDSTLSLGPIDVTSTKVGRPNVLEGRLQRPGSAREVFVNPRFADRFGLHVGDRFHAAVLTRTDFEAFDERGLSPDAAVAEINRGELGTPLDLTVVGIGVDADDIVVDEGFEQARLTTTPAFMERHPDADAGYFGIFARLRNGAADVAAFKAAVQALPHEGAIEFQTTSTTKAKVDRAVRPDVGALTIFAIVIALTGLLLVGQAIARQTFLDSVDHASLRALGFQRAQLFGASMLRGAVLAVVAACIAVVGALVVSPFAPIGPARAAEPDRGFHVDAPVVGLGALAVLVAVLVLAAIPAWWFSRASRFAPDQPRLRVSRPAAWLQSAGAPVVAGTGVRMALEPGQGRTAVPVRTTVTGSALAIAAVVAAVTFAASLDHLVTTPRLYGWAWDLRVSTSGNDAADAQANSSFVASTLADSPQVAGFSDSVLSRLEIDGATVTALGVRHRRGEVSPTIVSGRAPRTGRELALGGRTLDQIGASVGDVVRVRSDAGGPATRMRIVGRVVLPGLGTYPGSDKTALGEGALLTRRALHRIGPDFGDGPYLVRVADNSDRAALERALVPPELAESVEVATLERPSDIVSYERVRNTPLLLAGLLALLAVATVAHALVTAVRRRRRDLAMLKTLGFTRRQVSASVAWQATTIGVAALVIGIPIGVIVGRWSWTTLAADLGTVAQPIVPLLALAAAVPLVLLVVNAVAFVPGRIAAGLRPAAALRSE